MSNKNHFLYTLLILLNLPLVGVGQDFFKDFKKEAEEISYHIDVFSQDREVIEVIGDRLNLIYTDRYGKKPSFLLTVRDWKNEIVFRSEENKKYGANYFSYPLAQVISNWEEDRLYTLEVENDMGRRFSNYLKIPIEPVLQALQAEIVASPIWLDCQKKEESVFEFYGNIDGGYPPYVLNWEISDHRPKQSSLKKDENIPIAGFSSKIQVIRYAGYQVLLHLRDACGQETEQIVLIDCEQKNKKANTIFVQPLKGAPGRRSGN